MDQDKIQSYLRYWNQEIATQVQEGRQPTESDPKIIQLLELADEGFKVIIVTMLSEVKENMLMVNKKIKKLLINKDTTKKNQREIIKLKN